VVQGGKQKRFVQDVVSGKFEENVGNPALFISYQTDVTRSLRPHQSIAEILCVYVGTKECRACWIVLNLEKSEGLSILQSKLMLLINVQKR